MLLVGAQGRATAETYYVAPDGDDADDGSIDRPWLTPHQAKETAVAGDTVYFREGEYRVDRFVYFNRHDGQAGAPITFASHPGETATIIYDRTEPISDPTTKLIVFIAADFIALRGLRFTQSTASYDALLQGDQRVGGISVWGNHATVEDCRIEHVSGLGLFVRGSDVLVDGCRISDTWSHGFYIAGANGEYRNNELDGSHGYSNQQGMQIQYVTASGNRVHHNIVRNGQASGVVFSGRVSDNDVFDNVFINPGSKDGGGYGVAVNFWHEDGDIGPGNRFYNNTVIGRTNSQLIASHVEGRVVEIFGNIFHTANAIPMGGRPESMIHDNIFWNISSTPPTSNRLIDPLLADPMGSNAAAIALLPGSPAIDTGAGDVFPEDDFFGTARPHDGDGDESAVFDVGAYEYVDVAPDVDAGPGEVDGGGVADAGAGEADGGDDTDAGAGEADGGDVAADDGLAGGCGCQASEKEGASGRSVAAMAVMLALVGLGRRARRRHRAIAASAPANARVVGAIGRTAETACRSPLVLALFALSACNASFRADSTDASAAPDATVAAPDATVAAPDASLEGCGNGMLDADEACDEGLGVNGAPQSCCDGACQFKPEGNACGDATDSECTQPDSCSAFGACVGNHEPLGLPCATGTCDGVGECSATSGNVYFVAPPPLGDDSNDGSFAAPWLTPHHAEDTAVAGDTVYFRQGEYFIYDFVYFNKNAGEPGAPITFASYPGEQATIVYDRTEPITDLTTQQIFFVSRPYLIFERLRITQSAASWDALIHAVEDWRGNSGFSIWASNVVVRGCEIFEVSGQGIYSNKTTSGGIYEGNYIHHTGNHNNLDHGMYLCGDDELVVNNIITDCAAYGLQIAGYTTVSNMRVLNNVFVRNHRSGLILWKDLDDVLITNNIFFQNGYYGIASWYAHGSGVVIDSNLFFDHPYGAIEDPSLNSDYAYTETGSLTGLAPLFVDDTSDFHLQSESPAVDAGKALAEVTTDRDGVPRPQGAAYDLGAYEHVP